MKTVGPVLGLLDQVHAQKSTCTIIFYYCEKKVL